MLRRVFHFATEGARGLRDLRALKTRWPDIRALTPAGDGRPVLVLPGIMSDDRLTKPLQDCLREKGYAVYGWGGGLNTGPSGKTFAHLAARLHEVHALNGGRKVALVGHSLGGIFARELAREYPDMVACVITLGSPFGMKGTHIPRALVAAYGLLRPDGQAALIADEDLARRRLTPPPVPATALYSRADGIVDWRDCLNPAAPRAENIEVGCSHTGMIYDPAAITAVLDRLAQDSAAWRPFARARYPLSFGAGPAPEDVPAHPRWRKTAASKAIFKKD